MARPHFQNLGHNGLRRAGYSRQEMDSYEKLEEEDGPDWQPKPRKDRMKKFGSRLEIIKLPEEAQKPKPRKLVHVDNSHSETAVWGAIIGNGSIAILKLVAYSFTGSGSMLSECIHSVADTLNQCLLVIGMRRSKQQTNQGPVGHYREAFVWALVSSVGIFFIGSGVTIYHGLHNLVYPHHLIDDIAVALLVLLISFLVEGYTLLIAILAVRKSAKASGVTFLEYVHGGADPTAVAVVLEDSVAVLGVLIAAFSIFITRATHNMTFDSMGSILIGILLGFVASFLIFRNATLLTGVSPSAENMADFEQILKDHACVKDVIDLRGEMLGLGVCRLKAEIEFDGRAIGEQQLKDVSLKKLHKRVSQSPEHLKQFLIEFSESVVNSVADIVDDIETHISAKVPGSVFIDLEAERQPQGGPTMPSSTSPAP